MNFLKYDEGNKTLFDYFEEEDGCDGPTKAQKWGGAFLGATLVTSCALG